jgi:hypothetical protein
MSRKNLEMWFVDGFAIDKPQKSFFSAPAAKPERDKRFACPGRLAPPNPIVLRLYNPRRETLYKQCTISCWRGKMEA